MNIKFSRYIYTLIYPSFKYFSLTSSYRLKCHKRFEKCSKFIKKILLSSKELQKCTYFQDGSLYLSNHPSFMTEFERSSSTVLHVWYVAACNENACYRQNAITFRRLKVFNQHASDEKLPTGDELETDALCGMEVYLQRFSRGISVSLSPQQTLLFVCLMSGERMTKPGYKYLIPCNKS